MSFEINPTWDRFIGKLEWDNQNYFFFPELFSVKSVFLLLKEPHSLVTNFVDAVIP